jgi:hypothetical protein
MNRPLKQQKEKEKDGDTRKRARIGATVHTASTQHIHLAPPTYYVFSLIMAYCEKHAIRRKVL